MVGAARPLMCKRTVRAEKILAAAPAVHDADGLRAVEAVNIEDHAVAVAPVRAEQQLGCAVAVEVAQQPAGCLVVDLLTKSK